MHALSDGLEAFKTSAEGEQTDLVFNEPIVLDDDVNRASQGLVPAEWKVLREELELADKIESAYCQAQRYQAGIWPARCFCTRGSEASWRVLSGTGCLEQFNVRRAFGSKETGRGVMSIPNGDPDARDRRELPHGECT